MARSGELERLIGLGSPRPLVLPVAISESMMEDGPIETLTRGLRRLRGDRSPPGGLDRFHGRGMRCHRLEGL